MPPTISATSAHFSSFNVCLLPHVGAVIQRRTELLHRREPSIPPAPSEPVISYEPRRVPAAKAIVSSSPSLETSGPPYSCFLGPDSTR